MAWLYVLHARFSLARGRTWQAIYMLNGILDQTISLACLRNGLPAHQGRGVDDLPTDLIEVLPAMLVRSLEPTEMTRAFDAVMKMLLDETSHVDASLADRLSVPIDELVKSSRGGES